MAAEDNHIRVDVADAIATVTIDREDRLNALNAAVIRQLRRELARLKDDAAVRGVIVTGAGSRAFVAGADIGELARMDPLAGIRVSRDGQETFRLLERLGKPVVAAINGYALGGGLELALACHLRVASSTARLGLPEVKLGIIPGYGGTLRLQRLVGRGRALELILTAEMISADEAHRIGLVNRVCEPTALMEETRKLLGTIVSNGPVALALAMESVDHAAAADTDDALLFESNLFGLLAATEDMREGMNAFLEKRSARFEGR